MPTPIAQLLSRTEYAGDGVTTVWDFSFSGGYLDRDHVKAYTETTTGIRTPLTVAPGDFVGDFTLSISPAVPVDSNLVIYRDTPKDLPLVDFSDGNRFTEAALDEIAKQAVFIAAETTDIVNTSDAIAAGAAAAAAAASAAAALAAVAPVPAAVAAAEAAAAAAAASAAAISLPLALTRGGTGGSYADLTAMREGINVPTRTGGGAVGIWGINITGNAATATSATTANTAVNNVLKAGDTMTGNLRVDASIGVNTAPSFTVDANGTTIAVGTKTAVSGAGGHVRMRDDTGTVRWLAGILGTGGATGFSIYDLIGGAERLRVDPNGQVGIGGFSASSRLYVKGVTSDVTSWSLYSVNAAGDLLLGTRGDGAVSTGTIAGSPYNLTTAVAANVVVQSDGYLYRSTSSIKYKTDVRDYSRGIDALMALRPVLYKGKGQAETSANFNRKKGWEAKARKDGKGKSVPESPDFAGFIAEEVDAAGLTEFVQYDNKGDPDALHYASMTALLAKAIQEQQAMIVALTARVAALEAP